MSYSNIHQKNVDGIGTNYTLDLNTGLTQVLADGTNTYLYGNGRISQTGSTAEYFLADALGSVRQLTDPAGAVTLTQSYAPYGDTISSAGSGVSVYQFTGEMRDANGLTYLRARYLDSSTGRFISRDIWSGDYNRPLSLNRWGYVEGNPINLTDPSGHDPYWCENTEQYPTEEARQKCYDDAYRGWGGNTSEVNLVLLCGTDMGSGCQGNYGDSNGNYRTGYKGVKPLTPVKNWAISKGYSFEYHGTKGVDSNNAESMADPIANSMSRRSRVYGTKHIIIGFSGGATFSTLVALRSIEASSSDSILLVVQIDSQIKDKGTNTQANINALDDNNIGIYGCHSEAYERGYLRFEKWWNKLLPSNYQGYERPGYSVLLPRVETHKEMAVRQDIFDMYIRPELEKAVLGIP